MANNNPKTTEDAIWDIHARVVRMETTVHGTPGTKEGGLVQEVQEIKSLAIEVKDANIIHGKNIAWLQARCRAFHGESGKKSNPSDNDNDSKSFFGLTKKKIGAIIAAAIFVAMVIYNLGGLCGWWAVK